jgi:hypothetical protein
MWLRGHGFFCSWGRRPRSRLRTFLRTVFEQRPKAGFESMRSYPCLEGCGLWANQEQPTTTSALPGPSESQLSAFPIMKKGNTAVHAEPRSTRRKSNFPPSALSAPPREKKSGWQTRTERGTGRAGFESMPFRVFLLKSQTVSICMYFRLCVILTSPRLV